MRQIPQRWQQVPIGGKVGEDGSGRLAGWCGIGRGVMQNKRSLSYSMYLNGNVIIRQGQE